MTINTKSVSVLLVDDDEINNFISIKLIKKALLNTEIMACLNGKFAIDQLSEIQRKDPAKLPDYILLDINMPIMDGLKLVKRVRSDPNHKDTPIVIITTEGANEDRQRALQLGANAYITKPIQAPQVIATVKELLKIE
jgi:CheY-like chemotaxis protein